MLPAAGGTHDAIVVSRSGDGGRTWNAPRAINRVPAAAAFTPVLHVRADGTVGVLHFDLRNDTPDVATLPANAWLLTSSDGVDWVETAVGTTFDMALAPLAGGLFIGDYHGLVSIGSAFVPLLATTNADPANRTDVRAPRIDALADARAVPGGGVAAVPGAPRGPQKLTEGEQARLARAHQAAIVELMEQRVPGWQHRALRGGQAPLR